MSSFANSYFKYVNHLEQINDAALSAPERMIEEVEAAKKARKLDRETWQDEIGGPDSPSQAGLIGSLAEEWVIAREDVYAIYREIDSGVSEVVFKGFL